MHIHRFNSFEELLEKGENFLNLKEAVLTIGNFDGLHLGHRAVLERVKESRKPSVVFTFSTHPAEVLYNKKTNWLSSLEERLSLLKNEGIDHVILIPFTLSFSQYSAEYFLVSLKQVLSFSLLVIGHDAVIGHKREGNPDLLASISKRHHFSLEYVPAAMFENKTVSSSLIRTLINKGKIEEASRFLGRPFSIQGSVIKGASKGEAIGYPTANLSISGISLPPFGVWVVKVTVDSSDTLLNGVANLGYGPTLHQDRPPLLEVHLLDFQSNLKGCLMKVFFFDYLREEKRFPNLEALKEQIEKDICLARLYTQAIIK